MGYLCKYMAREGWEVTVLTEHIDDSTFAFLAGYAEVHYLRFYSSKGRLTRRMEWTALALADFLFGYKDRRMVREGAKLLRAGGFKAILCSSFRTFPLPAARKLARRFALPWVADTRDIIEQFPAHEYIIHPPHFFPLLDKLIVWAFRRKLLRSRNRALRQADCVTTVSPWHVERMKLFNPHVRLIYNGYDPELFYPASPSPEPQFRLTYTGRLISPGVRDPEWVFQAVGILSGQGVINPLQFRVGWYTDTASERFFRILAERYGVGDYMDYSAYVPADRVPDLLRRSSALLQLANKADANGPKGIMSTKLFEAFAVEKPLLLVRSDESFLEELILSSHSGVAARSVEDVCGFIRYYFDRWKRLGYTSVEPRREITEAFSRREQAAEFMRLLNSLANE
jgi:glycosyltransferase involved in cell wall biosynthesis